ncbi:MAG: hypothetical protein WC678_00015 [Parcubacteria group bacterium]|jgi:hypothetical protein
METLQKVGLFWDIDRKKLNPKKYKKFIIQRILEKGDLDDLCWAKNFYGKKELEEVFCQKQDKLDKKSVNFWQGYFNLKKSTCIQKLSIKKLSAFFTR